jgi:hypothetical protein
VAQAISWEALGIIFAILPNTKIELNVIKIACAVRTLVREPVSGSAAHLALILVEICLLSRFETL